MSGRRILVDNESAGHGAASRPLSLSERFGQIQSAPVAAPRVSAKQHALSFAENTRSNAQDLQRRNKDHRQAAVDARRQGNAGNAQFSGINLSPQQQAALLQQLALQQQMLQQQQQQQQQKKKQSHEFTLVRPAQLKNKSKAAVALKPAAKGGFVNKNAKPAVQAGNKPKSVVKPGQQKTANAKPQSGKKPQQGAKPAPGKKAAVKPAVTKPKTQAELDADMDKYFKGDAEHAKSMLDGDLDDYWGTEKKDESA